MSQSIPYIVDYAVRMRRLILVFMVTPTATACLNIYSVLQNFEAKHLIGTDPLKQCRINVNMTLFPYLD